jgi:hypothetical protein
MIIETNIPNHVGKQFTIKKSTRVNKKYDVFESDAYILSFGDSSREHYEDLIGEFSHLDHKDKDRLNNFYSRFKTLYNKNRNNPYSPIFYSARFLWPLK